MSDHKVIGYAAILSKNKYFAHKGSMLVAGSESILRCCIESTYKNKNAVKRYRTKKIRFWEIQLWLNNGTTISFDEPSYNNFAECSLEEGKKLKFSKFPEELKENSSGLPVIKVTHR